MRYVLVILTPRNAAPEDWRKRRVDVATALELIRCGAEPQVETGGQVASAVPSRRVVLGGLWLG